jgi:hypothetical protein
MKGDDEMKKMKKKIFLLIVVLLVAFALSASSFPQEGEIKKNDREVPPPPVRLESDELEFVSSWEYDIPGNLNEFSIVAGYDRISMTVDIVVARGKVDISEEYLPDGMYFVGYRGDLKENYAEFLSIIEATYGGFSYTSVYYLP